MTAEELITRRLMQLLRSSPAWHQLTLCCVRQPKRSVTISTSRNMHKCLVSEAMLQGLQTLSVSSGAQWSHGSISLAVSAMIVVLVWCSIEASPRPR